MSALPWLECVVILAVAAGLAQLGRWGRAHPEALVAPYLAEEDRERKVGTLQRGALTCYAAALVLAVVAILCVL